MFYRRIGNNVLKQPLCHFHFFISIVFDLSYDLFCFCFRKRYMQKGQNFEKMENITEQCQMP